MSENIFLLLYYIYLNLSISVETPVFWLGSFFIFKNIALKFSFKVFFSF